MLSIIKKIFGFSPREKNFSYLIIDKGDPIDKNRWYRLSHWQSPHFLRMESEWSKDWKCFSNEEEVVGVSLEDHQRKFLILGDQSDFRVFLRKDPHNPHDKNALEVMASATVDGEQIVEQLGFLSKETAKQLKDEDEIDARPYSVYLPFDGNRYGLRISVLVRSQSFKKRMGISPPMLKSSAKKKPIQKGKLERDIRKEVFDETYEYFDDAREDYDCKKVSKKLFKEVFDLFFEQALSRRGFSETKLNNEENDHDLDLQDDLIDALDDIVAELFKRKPELEKNG